MLGFSFQKGSSFRNLGFVGIPGVHDRAEISRQKIFITVIELFYSLFFCRAGF